MGWNTGYTIMEATVIGAYNLGRLDRKLLKVLMEPYRDTDIDRGGSEGLVTRNGLSVEDVVLEVLGMKAPKKPDGPDDYSKQTEKQRAAWDRYHEKRGAAFDRATKRYGW